MLRRARIGSLTFALGLGLALLPGCEKQDTTDPEVGSNLIGGAGGGGGDEFSSGEFSDSQLPRGCTRLKGSSFCGSIAAIYSVYCFGIIES